MRRWLHSLWFLVISPVIAQNVPTVLQIPPLQWINLSRLYKGGSQPIPLRDAHIAYDPAKRVLIIFGGESSAGVPTQQTYVLQLDDLTWRVPVPPAAQQDIPPPRSAGVYGQDLASNYRNGMLIWGGKGTSGPLNDLWYYHYQNEFWAKIPMNGSVTPQGRWGAAGGTAPASVIQNVETFMWFAGGENSTSAFTFDDVWQLDMTGVIAAGSVVASGTWSKVQTSAGDPTAMTRYGITGAVIPPVGNTDRQGTLVVFGGCDVSSSSYNASCAQNTGSILTLPTDRSQTAAQWATAGTCPPGSYGASIAPNRNLAGSSFSSQVFLFPGAVDTKLWNDPTGLQAGEVGVLQTPGVWARVLPAGDPGSNPNRPTAKQGAAVFTHTASITGSATWTDTVVFGGVDVTTGMYTNEMWLLRAYNDQIQSSDQHWTGYGDGNLQTGVNATGTGVTVQFLTQCASQISIPGSPTSSNEPHPSTTGTPNGPAPTSTSPPSALLDASPVHKILSPVSVAMILPAILLFRASSGPTLVHGSMQAMALLTAGGLIGIGAEALGIVGFVLGVSRVTKNSSNSGGLRRRADSSSDSLLSTPHSQASLILFIVLYGVVPIIAAVLFFTGPRWSRARYPRRPRLGDERKPTDSTIPSSTVAPLTAAEKGTARSSEDDILMTNRSPGRVSIDSQVVGESEEGGDYAARRRAKSLSIGNGLFSGLMSTDRSRRKSDLTLSSSSRPPSAYNPPPNNGGSKFEVVNRPKRASAPGSHTTQQTTPPSAFPRNPSDLSWMERRRSVNVYGQLDYEMSQGTKSPPPMGFPPAPSSGHEMSPTTPSVPAQTPPQLPPRAVQLWFNILLQIVVLWGLAFWIVTFAIMGKALGVILVAIATILYYIAMVWLAWIKRPRHSVLVVFLGRLRGDPSVVSKAASTPTTDPSSTPLPHLPGHPYLNSPPWRSVPHEEDPLARARSVDSDPAEDEDDAVRQAQIEEEIARRDVSIFTVPKRRLVVRN